MRSNSLRTADSYDRVDVVSPLDGSVIPAYDREAGVLSRRVANVDSTNADMKRWYNGFDLASTRACRGGVRAFGGMNIERSLNDTCVSAASDPNRSLYCDQSRERHSVAEAVQGARSCIRCRGTASR